MKKLFVIILFLLAFIERVFVDLGPNIELITLAMLLSAAYMNKKQAFWLTLLIMATTDLIIGNTNIFIFTWSGFLIPAFIAGEFFSKNKTSGLGKIGLGTISGIGSSLFFYFWTNLGVWLMGSMYPKTLAGLAASYINGLPFLKLQFISTLLFVPIGFGLMELNKSFRKSPSIEKSLLGI